jgi:hypothetical protein
MSRKVFYGAMNEGTVNVAEVMAYVQPILWYLRQVQDARSNGAAVRKHTVHIITDSEYTANTGNKGHIHFKTNQLLWMVFELVKRHGLEIKWHWAQREDVDLNTYADILSKKARGLVKDNNQIKAMAENGIDVHDVNPWE